ncbi:MAG TPA: 2-deoxy-D-gluconate 3-dehydrogenase, partial [Rikenellaceae bacterium]|nr:2-deoxy-D-gluconate 3-dehydrogenase [Rikenellaceae bacterium]
MNYKNILDFSNKNVLITGGAGSLGSEFARAFASCGANIIISDINGIKASEILDECRSYGVKANFLPCDLRSVDSIKKMVSDAINLEGKIDILCNHAGFNIRKPAVEYTEEEWDALMEVDLKAIFFVATEVGKHMISNRAGKIINTASVSAVRGHKNLSIYASAKGGILQLTKVLAHEWAEYEVNVNAIGPGYFVTRQTKEYLNEPETKK